MPHRRRRPFKPYMKQMRNYGYTRMVASAMAGDRHLVLHRHRFLPALRRASLAAILYGALGRCRRRILADPGGEWTLRHCVPHPRRLCRGVHRHPLGAAIGTSPHRSIVRCSAPLSCSSSLGVRPRRHQGRREIRRTGGRAGEGRNRDRVRTRANLDKDRPSRPLQRRRWSTHAGSAHGAFNAG